MNDDVKPFLNDFWWQKRILPVGQAAHWKVGPLVMKVLRLAEEWRVLWIPGDDLADNEFRHEFPFEGRLPDSPQLQLGRFALGDRSGALTLEPCLADRPVVTRPESPVWILPDDEATFYVSSPLFVRVRVGDLISKQLLEIPILRPSDTWFGPSAMEGELCYASRTKLMPREDALLRLRHRAISHITIENAAPTPLFLERLKLPVPYLSLYMGADGVCSTNSIVFRREKLEDYAHVHIVRKDGPGHDDILIHEPRLPPRFNSLAQVFNSFF